MYKSLIIFCIVASNFAVFAQSKINFELKKELNSILIEDQKWRDLLISDLMSTKRDSLAEAFKVDKKDIVPYIVKKIPLSDSLNLARVEKIIKQYGYPGKSLVGEGTNIAAYYVIQHSESIDKYLSLIKKAADKKAIKFPYYAMMLDRSLMYKGEEQIYGTQAKGFQKLNSETGKKEFVTIIWPIKDVMNVNKKRLKAGFENTVEEYAKNDLGINYTVISLIDAKKMIGTK